MIKIAVVKIRCRKCGKEISDVKFFKAKDGNKMDICKECVTMHIDNYNPDTFTWILKEVDVPFVPILWEGVRSKAIEGLNPKKPFLDGMSVIGKYISKMKLSQWNKFGYDQAEEAIKKAMGDIATPTSKEETRIFNEQLKEKFAAGEISEAQYQTELKPDLEEIEEQSLKRYEEHVSQAYSGGGIELFPGQNQFNEKDFIDEELLDLGKDLTDDDKIYLAVKWGRLYKPKEWIELEKTYNEMMESFDIQDADTINSLILICKTNLKMNQALDMGDIEGFQKISKVSEGLRKSAKFTASQKKEQESDYIDSIGELVRMCEQEGFIPKFATDIPQDIVDITLKDMNQYVHNLITKDLGFGRQIEDAIKKIEIKAEMHEMEKLKEAEEWDGLSDEDYEAFFEDAAVQKAEDLGVERDYDEEGDSNGIS